MQPSREYSKGYVAGRKHNKQRINELENELAALRLKTPTKEEHVEYLLTTAGALLTVAKILTEAEAVPNA